MERHRVLILMTVLAAGALAGTYLLAGEQGGHSHAVKAEKSSCCGTCKGGDAKSVASEVALEGEKSCGVRRVAEVKGGSCGSESAGVVMTLKEGASCSACGVHVADQGGSCRSGVCEAKGGCGQAVAHRSKSGKHACPYVQLTSGCPATRSKGGQALISSALSKLDRVERLLKQDRADEALAASREARTLLAHTHMAMFLRGRPAPANTHCPLSQARIDPAKVRSATYRSHNGVGVALRCGSMARKWDGLSAERKQAHLDKIAGEQTSRADDEQ
jgi:hypothetical protein